MYRVESLPISIPIGRQGENHAMKIEIDCSSFLVEWPQATITAMLRRSVAENPYILVTSIDSSGILTWEPTAHDTGIEGDGQIEIRAVENDVLAKSVTAIVCVERSLTPPEPDTPIDWVEDIKSDIAQSVTSAANSASDAAKSAASAQESAAAVGTRLGALEGRVTALEGVSIAVDATLTQSGKAADAKAVGDAVQGLQAAHDNLAAEVGAIQPGLTQAEKSALLTLLGAAAYGSDDMAATYASLKALWEGGDVPVMAVNVTPTTLNMTVGGTATLKATVIPGTATDKTVSWSVSPTGIVNVNGGNVEAVNVGECVITATAGGVSGTCAVSVQAAAIPATEITLDKNALELTEGGTATLTATVTPANSTDNVVWSVSPAGFATVTGGVVEALKAGNCTITATAGSKSATCAVTVKAKIIAVQSVTLNKNALTLAVGKNETLTATVLPANSTDRTVVWSVSPSGFATVAGGVVTAQAAGSCTVTASCGGKSASCAVTVESAIKEVTVDTAIAGTGRVWNTRTPLCQSLFVPLTIKQDFTLKKLDFMINLAKNTSIEVSFYNKTEGKNEGTNVTLAGTEGDYHAVVNFGGVDVLAGNEYQIWLNSTEKDAMCYPYVRDAVIAENDYFDITGTAYRWNNSFIKYLGYVVLTQDTSANIEVKSVTLSQNALTLRVGGSATLKATVVPSNATDRKVVWSVSPSGYATVTDGKVSATAAGNCVITATAGGKSATCAVTVKAAVTPTVLYELPNETTLVSSSKQSIDTGVKLFENAGTEPPAYTILLDMAVASDISYNPNLSPCIMHAYDEAGDKMGTNLAIWGNGKVMLSYNGDTQAFAGVTKPADMFTRAKYAIQIDGLKIRSCKAGALGDWTTGTNALESINETLLFGAGRGSDGSLTRYFDGTFYAIKVYSGLLSDDALNEFLQG